MFEIGALKKLGILVVLGGLTGCATVGKPFNYQNRDALELGETKKSEAIALLGEPHLTGGVANQDGKFDHLRYSYAEGSLGGSAARVLILEFKGGVLNAYVYNSGFPEDSTSFAYDRLDEIEVGESTGAEAIAALGKPSGRANCPSYLADFSADCAQGSEVVLWMFTSGSQGLDTSTIKTDQVSAVLDADGVVQNIRGASGN